MPKENKRPVVSVLIPSYMGQALLAKHLNKVLAIMQAGDQLIIIDDASPDNNATLNFIVKKFKLKHQERNQHQQQNQNQANFYQGQWQGIDILLAINQKNLRFGASVNFGFSLAKHPLVFLLNNDVAPHPDVLQHLIPHFQDQEVFAVSCLEKNGSQEKDWAGKNKLWFERGIFQHSKADNFTSGPNSWASGGSSLIDRKKFLAIGGFDQRYQPAYWEDVDLSFQAKKKAWQVIFEAKAIVEHHHESTNQTVFGQQEIDRVSWRNAKKFTRKNADFWQKIAYLLWRPYWLVKEFRQEQNKTKFKNCLILLLILLLAAALRFYQLGRVPQGMTLDEAAIGYNGFAIWQSRRDEWLEFLPISFRSFGDYKAPLAIYLNAFSTALFGLNLWAVRLPFAIFSLLALLGFYFLAKELLMQNKMDQKLALWATFFMALSPWHIHYSRLGFEAGIALSLLIWALYFFYKYFRQQRFFHLLLSTILACSTLYAYHSSKITTPLLFIVVFLFEQRKKKINWKHLLTAVVLALFFLSPLAYDAIYGQGLTRAGSSILFKDISIIEKIKIIAQNTLSYFSWNFLAKGEVNGQLRHGDGRFGVLSYPAVVLIITYILSLFSPQVRFEQKSKKILLLIMVWLIIGNLPAIIGDQAYHSNRALLALPAWILLEVLAYDRLRHFFQNHRWGLKYPIIIAYLIFIFVYQRNYYLNYQKTTSDAFNEGYLETIDYLKTVDQQGIDKILFTNDYQHAYLYVLFGKQINPIAYQGGSLAIYEFNENIDFQDLNREKTIVVASKDDKMLHYKADHTVYGSDGSERFRIYLPKD